MTTDLFTIMVDGTIKAEALHAQANGLVMPDHATNVARLKTVIGSEWHEFLDTIKNAYEAHMGEPMYKTIMNTYCNSWAVKVLKGV